MPGYVVHEDAVKVERREGDTARVRLTIDRASGCEQLEQRVIRFGSGRSLPRETAGREEVLYVASGRGSLLLDGDAHALEPGTGAYVRPGERYEIESSGPDELTVVSIAAPEPDGDPGDAPRKVTVRAADKPLLPAGKDREFRFVIDREAGCREVTQFLGAIPPGRAKVHYHTYDEVVYIIEGEGILHLDGQDDRPIAGGSCIHLPPLVRHCLENTGTGPLRILGVFHPAGDPSEAYNVKQDDGGGGSR